MKVFQAIYTSAVRTLDQRQGLGLVFCSADLPEEIRGVVSRFGYDREAEGAPIYSFERFDAGGGSWLLLNRTVPAVDYTGRTSCVSHTLAIRESELHVFGQTTPGPFPNIFEFARNFAWKNTWEGEPMWEPEGEILTIANTLGSVKPSALDTTRARSPAALLAFEEVGSGSFQPRRAAWQLPGQSPEEILDLFSEIWCCIDPWRGESPYKSALDEPYLCSLASWTCSFTTNLRNNRPDPYRWVVLSPKVPHLPGREILEPEKWRSADPNEVKRLLALNGIPDLMVERIEEGPTNWAIRCLNRKLQELDRRYDEGIRAQNENTAQELGELIGRLETEIGQCKPTLDGVRSVYKAMFGESGDLVTCLEPQFANCKYTAEKRSRDLLEEYSQKSDPIRTLLSRASADNRGISDISPLFEQETRRFEELCEEWKQLVPVVRCYEKNKDLCSEWKKHCDGLQVELDRTKADLQRTEAMSEGLESKLTAALQSKKWAEEKQAELGRQRDKLTEEIESLRAAFTSNSEPSGSGDKRARSHAAAARFWMWAFCGVCGIAAVIAVIFFFQLRSARASASPRNGVAERESDGPAKRDVPASPSDAKGGRGILPLEGGSASVPSAVAEQESEGSAKRDVPASPSDAKGGEGIRPLEGEKESGTANLPPELKTHSKNKASSEPSGKPSGTP